MPLCIWLAEHSVASRTCDGTWTSICATFPRSTTVFVKLDLSKSPQLALVHSLWHCSSIESGVGHEKPHHHGREEWRNPTCGELRCSCSKQNNTELAACKIVLHQLHPMRATGSFMVAFVLKVRIPITIRPFCECSKVRL